jgi:hypothetical protein
MRQQFNIQQLYALPTLYLCVLYVSEHKQQLVPLTAYTAWIFVTEMKNSRNNQQYALIVSFFIPLIIVP